MSFQLLGANGPSPSPTSHQKSNGSRSAFNSVVNFDCKQTQMHDPEQIRRWAAFLQDSHITAAKNTQESSLNFSAAGSNANINRDPAIYFDVLRYR